MTSPCAADTSTITLNQEGVNLVARLRTSAAAGNRVGVNADGLYVGKTGGAGAAGVRMSDLTLYGPFDDGNQHYFLDGALDTVNPSGADPMYVLAAATWDPIQIIDLGAANRYSTGVFLEANGPGVVWNDGPDQFDDREVDWSAYAFPNATPLNAGPSTQPGTNLRFFSIAATGSAHVHWFRYVQRTLGSGPFYVVAHTVKAGVLVVY